MKTTNLKSIASLLMLTLFLASCGGAPEGNTESSENIYGETEETSSTNYGNILDDDDTESYDIATLIKGERGLSTFAELLERSQVSLEFAEPVTLLAPTNEAFEQLPDSHLEHLKDSQNRADLVRFINRHIIPSEVSVAQFNNNHRIDTPMDEVIRVSVDMSGRIIRVGGAEIIKSDIETSNGIIHVVDAVVQPTEEIIRY